MENMLRKIFEMQLDLQENYFNVNFQRMLPTDRVRYVKDMALALTAELHEALDETGWKPWATKRGILDRDAYVGELVDVLHFLVNLFLVTGEDPVDLADEVFTRYTLKNQVNRNRQAAGYDGVSTKCAICQRALDDPAVACSRDGDQGYCAREGADVNYISFPDPIPSVIQ